MLSGIDNHCHCEARRAVAISRNGVTNRKTFDEWLALVQSICYSAFLSLPLYQEISTPV